MVTLLPAQPEHLTSISRAPRPFDALSFGIEEERKGIKGVSVAAQLVPSRTGALLAVSEMTSFLILVSLVSLLFPAGTKGAGQGWL